MSQLVYKRQPRGKEPLKQKSLKLPERITDWMEAGARREGVTEARFLSDQIRRRIFGEADGEEVA